MAVDEATFSRGPVRAFLGAQTCPTLGPKDSSSLPGPPAVMRCASVKVLIENLKMKSSASVGKSQAWASVAHASVLHHRVGWHILAGTCMCTCMHVRLLARKLVRQGCLHQNTSPVRMSVGILMMLYHIALRMITIPYVCRPGPLLGMRYMVPALFSTQWSTCLLYTYCFRSLS